jgi:DNA polymerase I-like protein with 3'-5' exonuclease and polymerase domains
MDIIFDIETNGLKPDKIHCLVAKPLGQEIKTFRPHEIEQGIKFLQQADALIGHNIIGFDIPVINKLYNVDLFKNTVVIDTLVMSRLFNPVRDGGHSLNNWGYIVRCPKGQEPDDWEIFTEDMLTYCKQDVVLNEKIFHYLNSEGEKFSEESMVLEHDVFKIMKQQEDDGFLFDIKKASILCAELKERMTIVQKEVRATFEPKWVDVKLVKPKFKKDGELSKSGLTTGKGGEYERLLESKDYKPFMRQKLQEFNLGSRKQIGEYLQDFGWKPNKFTPTGQPIVNESSLSKVKHIPEAKLIAEFLLLQKRIAQIESWINAVEKDSRIHGFVISNGTITGRMAHRSPNTGQVPNIRSEYGTECRSCWIVPKDYKLVGIDASGLELRMLAHYMNDSEYTNEIIHGDIHTKNQKTAGLKTRENSKTFIYALMYGAGDAKLGQVIGGNKTAGTKVRKHFFDNQPSFKILKDKVEQAANRGYLKGLDGRKIFIRNKHAALNSLLQGGGAIVMKKALVLLNDKAKQNNIDYKFVANIHDEWQVEVKENQAEQFGKFGIEAIKEAGQHFNMRCPLDGEFKIGEDWSETH